MEVIPAIDLKDGRCVRLVQGKFDKETVFSKQPVEMAKFWQAKGAKRLHLVDLDGARTGRPQNSDLICQIVSALRIPVQLGGGIRSMETVEWYLKEGVDRVILGTVALEEPDLVKRTIERFGPERIVVGVDASRGLVATRGWLETSEVPVASLLSRMKETGVSIFIYTDISRDGMLDGPDLEGLADYNQIDGVELIASGGISTGEDLVRLSQIGIESAIVGKAIYTGNLEPDFTRFSRM